MSWWRPASMAAGQRRGRDAGLTAHLGDAHEHLLLVAPRPDLVRLERADDRMAGCGVVGRRVPVGRVVAAADVAALQADAQVEPAVAAAQAVLAAVDGLG